MNPLDCLRLQPGLEGKEVIEGNLLRQVDVFPDQEMPLAANELVAYYDKAPDR